MSQSNDRGFVRGILLLIAFHVLAVIVGIAIANIISVIATQFPTSFSSTANNIILALYLMFFGIGIAQLIYVIPILVILNRRQRNEMMKGVITSAIVTALLNGACYLVVISSFR